MAAQGHGGGEGSRHTTVATVLLLGVPFAAWAFASEGLLVGLGFTLVVVPLTAWLAGAIADRLWRQ